MPCVCAWLRRLQMVPFAGYSLPVQYQEGVLQSHLHTRADDCASVFDVGHMGQIKWRGKDALRFLETLVVGDLESLKEVWMSRPPVSSPGACVTASYREAWSRRATPTRPHCTHALFTPQPARRCVFDALLCTRREVELVTAICDVIARTAP